MNLNNLEVGHAYKNYKNLCNTLGEKVKSGDTKYLQLLEFESYFKIDNNYTVQQIYEKPKLILDVDFAMIFVSKILLQLDNRIKLNKFKAEEELLRVKENKTLYNYYKYSSDNVNANEFINEYKCEATNKSIQILLKTALKRLQSSSLILFNDFDSYYSILKGGNDHLKDNINNMLYGCRPKRKPSLGERIIEDWLWGHRINYAFEYIFEDQEYPDINNKRFDFVLLYNNE